MSAYLDASALVSVFIADAHAQSMRSWLLSNQSALLVSPWALAEFSSALGVRRRVGVMDQGECGIAEQALDMWLDGGAELVEIEEADFAMARHLIRTGLEVKAADGLHLATTARLGAAIVSFDAQMRRAAEALGLAVQPI